jgi:hypothetical protein
MTATIAKKGLLWAKPQKIAEIIVRASVPNASIPAVLYAPPFWRWIMYVIRFMPDFVFHRTKL